MPSLNIEITQGDTDVKATLSGSLASDAVAKLNGKAHREITKHSKIFVDLSAVNEVDTAGLAWLLFVIEQANKHNCQLSFAHLPTDLLKLADLSAVSEFFATAS